MWVSEETCADYDGIKDGRLLLPFMQGDHLPLAGDSKIWTFSYPAHFSLKKESQMC